MRSDEHVRWPAPAKLNLCLSVAGPVRLDGGVFSIAGELAGAISLGSLDVTRGLSIALSDSPLTAAGHAESGTGVA